MLNQWENCVRPGRLGNAKSESRNPKQIRIPKSETRDLRGNRRDGGFTPGLNGSVDFDYSD